MNRVYVLTGAGRGNGAQAPRTARALSIRSARYSSSRRIQDLRVGKHLIPDHPVQPVLRYQVHVMAEEPLQVFLHVEVRHAQVVPRHPRIQDVNIAVWSGVTARDRAEDCQFGDAVLPAQLGQARTEGLDLVQVHSVDSFRRSQQQPTPRVLYHPCPRRRSSNLTHWTLPS